MPWKTPRPGTKIGETQVTNGSVLATILDVLGEAIPDGVYPSLLSHEELEPTRHSPSRAYNLLAAPVSNRVWGVARRAPPWKYLYWMDGTEELYNISSDPNETNNLLSRHRDVGDDMQEQVQRDVLSQLTPNDEPTDERTQEMLRELGYLE